MCCKYFRVSDISKGPEQHSIIKHTEGWVFKRTQRNEDDKWLHTHLGRVNCWENCAKLWFSEPFQFMFTKKGLWKCASSYSNSYNSNNIVLSLQLLSRKLHSGWPITWSLGKSWVFCWVATTHLIPMPGPQGKACVEMLGSKSWSPVSSSACFWRWPRPIGSLDRALARLVLLPEIDEDIISLLSPGLWGLFFSGLRWFQVSVHEEGGDMASWRGPGHRVGWGAKQGPLGSRDSAHRAAGRTGKLYVLLSA